MLSIIADSMLTATRREKWPAPDHWKSSGRARGPARYDEDAASWRRHIQRDTGLW